MMKKLLIPFLFLILFIFISCDQQSKINITIEGDIASPSFPIKIQIPQSLDYEVKFFEGENEIKYEKNGSEYYFKDLKEGKHTLRMEIYKNKNKVSERTFTFYYDTTAPEIGFLNVYLKSGELNVTAASPATDLSRFILKDASNTYNFNINIKIPLKKDIGTKNFELYAVDKYGNISKEKIITINTGEDKPPKILNDTLKISVFGDTNIKLFDDWTKDEDLKVFLKTKDGIYSTYTMSEILDDTTDDGTLLVIDNGNNITTKKIKIEVEYSIPSMPSGNPKLIDYSVDTFGWDYETDIESYIVETPYEYGWKKEVETKAAYARLEKANVAMIRKKSKFGTLSFPSQPTIRFSGTFVHLVRNILESSNENLYLPQINSEFLIGGETVLGKDSVVMVESGSILKFVSNSKLVIKGVFFIMPGPGKSLINGNGEIIVDGGIFIASKTIFDKVKIIGKNAKLIYLEDSEFLENSDLISSNDFRICLYNTIGYKTQINLFNSEEIFIKESTFKNIVMNNVNMLESIKSVFANVEIENLSKAYIDNSSINTMIQKNFSWSKIVNSNINDLNVENYSRSVIDNSKILNIINKGSTVIK
ncbi:hypothetical protein XO11_06155 [Marinitoga sp. 1138]|nr:hypothetical protein [Marinitoga sp. 1138]